MYCGSPSSVTHAENCAESATIDAPQMTATLATPTNGPLARNPTATAHAPLTVIETIVTSGLPTRSATTPAITHPAVPAEIVAKASTGANAGSGGNAW